jgi:hypothetical protein
MSIILDAMKNLIACKQKDGEQLQEYTKQFKTACDVLEQHIGGPLELTCYMTTLPDYDVNNVTKVTKCRELAYTHFLAFTYLDNSEFLIISIQHQSQKQIMFSATIALTM